MSTTADLVRSVLRWSLRVVQVEEARHTRHPGPRLSQMLLGDLMARGDPETAFCLAMDIWDGDTPVQALMASVSSGWGAVAPPRRRRGDEEVVFVASSVVEALRRHFHGHDRSLLERAAAQHPWNWRALADLWPGRDPRSLRDDFERLAELFYRREKNIICDASDLALKVGKMRNLSL